jgi:ribonucleoside-diphosphate reductase alpha chain
MEKKFFQVMNNSDFLPNSPTLMNAGLQNGQLSGCFVLPIEDSLQSIFTTLKNAALIHQSGGGTGFNFSHLRPKNDLISSSGGTSSGPIAFLKIYDAATKNVKQGGKRRGANMGILNVSHPDIEEFIYSKASKNELQNFNLSVGITNNFMHAISHNLEWNLINPRTKQSVKKVKATKIWQDIIEQAWKTGDPGLLFLDTINKANPTPNLGIIESTNPCGEVPLLDYESCNLGSLNLSKMVCIIKDKPSVDWVKSKTTITIAIRFLDNIITVNHYILKENKKITLKNRKIGLGVMGWAEMLLQLNIPYASKKAIRLAEEIMQFIKENSYTTSHELAIEKGTFKDWKNGIHAKKLKLRNATCNSIAPTGTISIIANTSYSIEPLFALAFKRSGILNGRNQIEINRFIKEKLLEFGFWDKYIEQTILKTGSIQQLNNLPKSVKNSLKQVWIFLGKFICYTKRHFKKM